MNEIALYLKGIRKILLIASIFIIGGIAFLFVHKFSYAVFIFFGGILFGIFLDGVAGFISSKIRINRKVILPFIILSLFAVAFFLFWFGGTAISNQLASLQQQIPQLAEKARTTLQGNEIGKALLTWISQSKPLSKIFSINTIATITSLVLESVLDGLVVFFIGMFLAFDNELYRKSILYLFPASLRDNINNAFSAVARALRRWLLGRVIIMSSLGVLTWIGLIIVHAPLAFLLGTITALFSFVPFIGPILAAIPAFIVGLSMGLDQAAYVLCVYLIAQFLENNLLTPIIQQFVTSLPAALLIAVQIVFGIIGGIAGLLFATPVTVTIVVLIQTLYVQDYLKEKIALLGRKKEM